MSPWIVAWGFGDTINLTALHCADYSQRNLIGKHISNFTVQVISTLIDDFNISLIHLRTSQLADILPCRSFQELGTILRRIDHVVNCTQQFFR